MADKPCKVKETLKEVQKSREKVIELMREVRSAISEPPERKYSPYRNEMPRQWIRTLTKR